jgi:hypothetical protein
LLIGRTMLLLKQTLLSDTLLPTLLWHCCLLL